MKMNVEILEIREEKADVLILIRCSNPHQKDTPFSKGREELDKNNKLFQKYADQYRVDWIHEMKEFTKRTQKLHIDDAQLLQDGEEP